MDPNHNGQRTVRTLRHVDVQSQTPKLVQRMIYVWYALVQMRSSAPINRELWTSRPILGCIENTIERREIDGFRLAKSSGDRGILEAQVVCNRRLGIHKALDFQAAHLNRN